MTASAFNSKNCNYGAQKLVLVLDRLTLFFKHIVAMFDIFSNRELYTDLQLFFIYSDNDLISGIKI